jgi:hypothetical protein
MQWFAKFDFIANLQALCSSQVAPAPHLENSPGIQQLMNFKFILRLTDAI